MPLTLPYSLLATSASPVRIFVSSGLSSGLSVLPESSFPESPPFPVSSFPESSLPVSSFPESSLPVSSFPESSLPESSLPVSSLPVSSLPVSSLPELLLLPELSELPEFPELLELLWLLPPPDPEDLVTVVVDFWIVVKSDSLRVLTFPFSSTHCP